MLQDARSLSPDAQAALRLRAVRAVLDGMRQNAAARIFGVSERAVGKWMKAYRDGGDSALAKRKRGPKGERGRLAGWQAAVICNLIRDRHPEQLRLPFALWTSDAVRRLIKRRFGVSMSSRTVRRYLRRWGFTPQKPMRRAYERDPEAVKRWLEEEYPAIRAQAKRERARIYWGDEMGMRSDHQAGRSYAPRGHTPTRAGTGQRFRCNMISALTNRGRLAFMIFKGRFNAGVYLRFTRRLLKEAKGRKVFLIVDRHPAHRAKKVQTWLGQRDVRERMRMFYLPAYSPELNPDECVNQDVKSNAVGRRCPRTRTHMMRTVRRYLEDRRRNPDVVRRYFHEDCARYAAW